MRIRKRSGERIVSNASLGTRTNIKHPPSLAVAPTPYSLVSLRRGKPSEQLKHARNMTLHAWWPAPFHMGWWEGAYTTANLHNTQEPTSRHSASHDPIVTPHLVEAGEHPFSATANVVRTMAITTMTMAGRMPMSMLLAAKMVAQRARVAAPRLALSHPPLTSRTSTPTPSRAGAV